MKLQTAHNCLFISFTIVFVILVVVIVSITQMNLIYSNASASE